MRILTTLLLLISFCFNAIYAQTKTAADINKQVDAKLKQMTLEEKVGQMAQVAIDVIGKADYAKGVFVVDPAKLNEVVVTYKVGSILNSPPGILNSAEKWNEVITAIQNESQKTRMKIPVIYGLDNIHGVNYAAGATLFPQQIGMAATWNRKLVYESSVIMAYESRAVGVPWTFSPVLDLGVNPAWPRIWEGFGEDPYLSAEMGVQFVKGAQNPLDSKEKVAVSLKHYMAYSDPKSGKDRTDAWIPEHYLREYHLPGFKAAIDAGGRTVMVNSALINGVPTHINKYILTDILKNELKFTGFVVTDWQDIENIYRRDKMAKDIKEAIMLSINAGIDMAMIPYDYKGFCTDLIALVNEKKVAMSRIDDAVRRILRVKYELDLFNTPVTTLNNYPKYASEEFKKAAYNSAAESITLLKNQNNVLPIPKTAKVLVTGPNSNSMRTLNGGWTYTWQGENTDIIAKDHNTIYEAAVNTFGRANVIYEPGVIYKTPTKYADDTLVNLEMVAEAAATVDYILLCVGENSYTETPGNINDLRLSNHQMVLLNRLGTLRKPIILILNEGRPRIFSSLEWWANAIVDIYLPGNFGADALMDVLTGVVNPSGKLPITYPRYSNDLVNYFHKPSEGSGNPQGGESNQQYDFGFGLSYTTFEYSNLTVNKKTFGQDETVAISVSVKNTGSRTGKEVVQLYISDLIASNVTPDVKRLRGFEKIEIPAGESRTVSFKLPLKQLAFINTSNKPQLEPGEFLIQIAKLTEKITVR